MLKKTQKTKTKTNKHTNMQTSTHTHTHTHTHKQTNKQEILYGSIRINRIFLEHVEPREKGWNLYR